MGDSRDCHDSVVHRRPKLTTGTRTWLLLASGVVLQTVFTKVCMGCKRFFLKERKNVMFLNEVDLPYCLVVFFVVCPRLRPFCFRRVNTSLLSSKSHVRVPLVSLGHLCVILQILNLFTAVFIVYPIISKIVSRTFIRIITASCFSYSYS